MPTVRSSDGTSIAYQTRGEGPLNLVFMHGWAETGSKFNSFLDLMDLSGVRAITLDVRGHGGSDPVESGFTDEQLAKDLLAVADAVGAQRFVTVGFSMSARFVQYVPILAPERVIGQVLLAGCPTSALPLPEDMLNSWYDMAGSEAAFKQFMPALLTKPANPAQLDAYAKNAAKISRQVLQRSMEICTKTSIDIEKIKNITAPTLVVGGAKDAIFTPDTLRNYVAGPLPKARVALVDCGHEILWDEPGQVAALVNAFVAGLQ